jgi:hypothetical protein
VRADDGPLAAAACSDGELAEAEGMDGIERCGLRMGSAEDATTVEPNAEETPGATPTMFNGFICE